MEVNHAAFETAFVQQFELQADIVGEGVCAASRHDRRDEQVALVYQPGIERLSSEVGPAHAYVAERNIREAERLEPMVSSGRSSETGR